MLSSYKWKSGALILKEHEKYLGSISKHRLRFSFLNSEHFTKPEETWIITIKYQLGVCIKSFFDFILDTIFSFIVSIMHLNFLAQSRDVFRKRRHVLL